MAHPGLPEHRRPAASRPVAPQRALKAEVRIRSQDMVIPSFRVELLVPVALQPARPRWQKRTLSTYGHSV